MLVVDMGADSFATVCNAIYRENTPMIVITYYQDPITWPWARFMFKPRTAMCNEVVYNRNMGSLYLMNIYEIASFGSPYTNVNYYYYINEPYRQNSIDTLDIRGDAVISGSNQLGNSEKMLLKFDENPNDCIGMIPWDVKDEREYRGENIKNQFVYFGRMSTYYIQPDISEYELIIKCE